MASSALQASALALWLVVIPIVLPALVRAEIYKWVDDNGVVNYSEQPPPQRKAQVVVPERTPLTVYQAPTGSAPPAQTGDTALHERVGELERQLALERQQRITSAAQEAELEAQRLERCQRERRVDCAEAVLEVGYPTVLIHNRSPWWRHQRPGSRPNPVRPPPQEAEQNAHRALRLPSERR